MQVYGTPIDLDPLREHSSDEDGLRAGTQPCSSDDDSYGDPPTGNLGPKMPPTYEDPAMEQRYRHIRTHNTRHVIRLL